MCAVDEELCFSFRRSKEEENEGKNFRCTKIYFWKIARRNTLLSITFLPALFRFYWRENDLNMLLGFDLWLCPDIKLFVCVKEITTTMWFASTKMYHRNTMPLSFKLLAFLLIQSRRKSEQERQEKSLQLVKSFSLRSQNTKTENFAFKALIAGL